MKVVLHKDTATTTTREAVNSGASKHEWNHMQVEHEHLKLIRFTVKNTDDMREGRRATHPPRSIFHIRSVPRILLLY